MKKKIENMIQKQLTLTTQKRKVDTMSTRKNILVSVVLSSVLVAAQTATAVVTDVYWTDRDNGTLSVTNVGSAATTVLVTGGDRFQDVDLDTSTNTLYYADWGSGSGGQGSVNKVQTDGSGQGVVLGTGDAVHQLALDPANNRIYFTRAVGYDGREISRVDTNGANYTQLITGSSGVGFGYFYSGLALDSANNDLYWGDIGVASNGPPDGSVNRMTTTGASPTQLTPHVNGRGRGMALDAATQTLFYTSHNVMTPTAGGGLFSYDIVNDIETQLIDDPDTGYWDIEIDTTAQRLWWADAGRGQIRSSDFDGLNVVVELTGLTNPYGVALVPEPCTMSLLALGGLAVLRRRNCLLRRRRS